MCKRKRKEKWMRPKFIIFTRISNGQEAILGSCKQGAGFTPRGAMDRWWGCYFSGTCPWSDGTQKSCWTGCELQAPS